MCDPRSKDGTWRFLRKREPRKRPMPSMKSTHVSCLKTERRLHGSRIQAFFGATPQEYYDDQHHYHDHYHQRQQQTTNDKQTTNNKQPREPRESRESLEPSTIHCIKCIKCIKHQASNNPHQMISHEKDCSSSLFCAGHH
jgi:hypothetical protein